MIKTYSNNSYIVRLDPPNFMKPHGGLMGKRDGMVEYSIMRAKKWRTQVGAQKAAAKANGNGYHKALVMTVSDVMNAHHDMIQKQLQDSNLK